MANPNWVKGVSGNPKGRPPKEKAITSQIEKLLQEELTEGMTKAQAIALGIVNKAIAGDPFFTKLAMQYVDGMPEQKQIHVGEEGAPDINIRFSNNGDGRLQPDLKAKPSDESDVGGST